MENAATSVLPTIISATALIFTIIMYFISSTKINARYQEKVDSLSRISDTNLLNITHEFEKIRAENLIYQKEIRDLRETFISRQEFESYLRTNADTLRRLDQNVTELRALIMNLNFKIKE